jgi:hypothetical protein
MCSLWSRLLVITAFAVASFAAPRQHTVAFGHWRVVKAANNEDGREQQVRVRPLFIDGRLREYTTGTPHDVTDRLFVVRRIRRVNDSLPGESADKPQWLWQFDTWLSVDRLTGHIAQLSFPAFDPDISQASWYRDYAAYCGPSEGGDKMYMVVVQLGRRKPILKKPFAGVSCPAPVWERNPSRVTFNVGSEKTRFVVHAQAVSPGTEPESGEEGPQ